MRKRLYYKYKGGYIEMMKKSKQNAEHYIWGDNCDGSLV
ncbi:hypothetical protein SRABI134_05249 [Peribacillus sp. Bi134]|nr:hypothetical protein SRABI134_05249 [Peribacillus sp. Bi134]